MISGKFIKSEKPDIQIFAALFSWWIFIRKTLKILKKSRKTACINTAVVVEYIGKSHADAPGMQPDGRSGLPGTAEEQNSIYLEEIKNGSSIYEAASRGWRTLRSSDQKMEP